MLPKTFTSTMPSRPSVISFVTYVTCCNLPSSVKPDRFSLLAGWRYGRAEYEQITEDVRGTVKSLREEALLEAKWEEEKVEEEKHRRRAQIKRSKDGD